MVQPKKCGLTLAPVFWEGAGVLKGKKFYYGTIEALDEVKKALKYSDVKFEFAIAQPGVKASELTDDMMRLLSSV